MSNLAKFLWVSYKECWVLTKRVWDSACSAFATLEEGLLQSWHWHTALEISSQHLMRAFGKLFSRLFALLGTLQRTRDEVEKKDDFRGLCARVMVHQYHGSTSTVILNVSASPVPDPFTRINLIVVLKLQVLKRMTMGVPQ